MNDTTFKLRVPTSELEAWRAKAGKRGLSAWIRERCNAKAVESMQAQPREVKEGFRKEVFDVRMPSSGSDSVRAPRTCIHHKERGSLCYKCDPKFGNPVIG